MPLLERAELLERQRVDGPQRLELLVERCRSFRRFDALRQIWSRCTHGRRRLGAKVPTDHVDDRLKLDSDLR